MGKEKKPSKKSTGKLPVKKASSKKPPVEIKVDTVKPPADIDWNYWHKPMVESILAFKLHETVGVVNKFGLVHPGKEREPITADTLVNDMFRLCETLVRLHLEHWTYTRDGDSPDREANIYRDDNGALVAELNYVQSEDGSELFLDPKLAITLYASSECGPWFKIDFQLVSQFF